MPRAVGPRRKVRSATRKERGESRMRVGINLFASKPDLISSRRRKSRRRKNEEEETHLLPAGHQVVNCRSKLPGVFLRPQQKPFKARKGEERDRCNQEHSAHDSSTIIALQASYQTIPKQARRAVSNCRCLKLRTKSKSCRMTRKGREELR